MMVKSALLSSLSMAYLYKLLIRYYTTCIKTLNSFAYPLWVNFLYVFTVIAEYYVSIIGFLYYSDILVAGLVI